MSFLSGVRLAPCLRTCPPTSPRLALSHDHLPLLPGLLTSALAVNKKYEEQFENLRATYGYTSQTSSTVPACPYDVGPSMIRKSSGKPYGTSSPPGPFSSAPGPRRIGTMNDGYTNGNNPWPFPTAAECAADSTATVGQSDYGRWW